MSTHVLVIGEHREGKLNRTTWEAITAGQKLAADLGGDVSAVLLGQGINDLGAEVAGKQLAAVYLVEDEKLAVYTPDGYAAALAQVVGQLRPYLVVMSHTYQVRDFAPKVAASLGRPFISDCIGYRKDENGLIFVRQIFQGKINADVTFVGEPPYFVSFQAGAFRGDEAVGGATPVRPLTVDLSTTEIRTRPMELFREAKQAVDLSQAERIVAVGRGIKSQENMGLVEKLAEVLGAEIGASRPICDSGWLPMERQIGSSGQTVSPKLYLAVGISGAIQHVVGMKGSRTIVAINKDRDAPIFDIADYGIVGDLFEIVPALIKHLEATKE
ncbi:MAG TPA: electron transfer flavoprotein subunit alpha/FixB family protein [Blastocatellia bacterium]|nr:electron transfer flavoprotein subunit alpha/FixB family protein [Blastocatellia bacterium]